MEYQRRSLTEIDIAQRLESVDRDQAHRYARLSGPVFDLANEGLRRHLRVCERLEVDPEASTIRGSGLF